MSRRFVALSTKRLYADGKLQEWLAGVAQQAFAEEAADTRWEGREQRGRACEIPGYPRPANLSNLGLNWCGSNVGFQRRAFGLQAAGAWCAIAGARRRRRRRSRHATRKSTLPVTRSTRSATVEGRRVNARRGTDRDPTCGSSRGGRRLRGDRRDAPIRTGSYNDPARRRMMRMRAVRLLVASVMAVVVLAAPRVVLADGRVALVVGNSTYAHIGRLPNPDNDARDMAAALRRLGFEVTTEFDADRAELTEALRRFTRQSAGADVSLVFYAGHGIEMDGVNYLVPVDARLERDVDVCFETVTVDDLLVSTSGASLRLLILDACRNNPLARSMQRTAAIRSVSGGSFGDLNEDLLGDETLVAYAAAAGTTAADGRGRNSPYTSALLAQLEQPLEIGLLFRRVRAQVLASTNGAQRPHEYHSLSDSRRVRQAGHPGVSRSSRLGTRIRIPCRASRLCWPFFRIQPLSSCRCPDQLGRVDSGRRRVQPGDHVICDRF